MKNSFRFPWEEKKPKKVGRLAQLSKSNRRAKHQVLAGLNKLEEDWIYEKKFGVVAAQF